MDRQANVAGVRKCGYHSRVVFRTDGEPAILDLMGEVARLADSAGTWSPCGARVMGL